MFIFDGGSLVFDVSLAPIVSFFISIVALAILCDFLLELVSVRLTLSTGRLQKWFFDRLSLGNFSDYLISISIQFLSFRKSAFFTQFSSFVNVGSFSKRQILFILTGTFIGIGLSALLFIFIHSFFSILLMACGFVLTLFAKDQLKDMGVAVLNFGMMLLVLWIFNTLFSHSTMNIHQFSFGEPFLFLTVICSTLLFRTPIAFCILLGMIHFLIQLNSWWLPLAFFVGGVFTLAPFYLFLLQGRRRVYYSIFITFGLQVIQLLASYGFLYFYHEDVDLWLKATDFITSFVKIVICFVAFNAGTLIITSPILYIISRFPFFAEPEEKERKKTAQKILIPQQRGSVFSLHFSLFLLRQEFIKFSTLVHTILKLGREADESDEETNNKIIRYQRVLVRVGDEIKELCFSVGKQRAYRWHIAEILTYYKYVNQLELLVEDLSSILFELQKKGIGEEWEKDCRYWMNLQLLTYEDFFNLIVGVPQSDGGKHKANIQKSYDVLDRLFADQNLSSDFKKLSKAFYRITESNSALKSF